MPSSVRGSRFAQEWAQTQQLRPAHDLPLQLLTGDPTAVVVVLNRTTVSVRRFRGFAWGYKAQVDIPDLLLLDEQEGFEVVNHALKWMAMVLKAEADAELEIGCA